MRLQGAVNISCFGTEGLKSLVGKGAASCFKQEFTTAKTTLASRTKDRQSLLHSGYIHPSLHPSIPRRYTHPRCTPTFCTTNINSSLPLNPGRETAQCAPQTTNVRLHGSITCHAPPRSNANVCSFSSCGRPSSSTPSCCCSRQSRRDPTVGGIRVPGLV